MTSSATDPFASIIENARVSHVLQWSLNPAHSAREARLECTCGAVFAKLAVDSDDAFTGAVRDQLWVAGQETALGHLKEKVRSHATALVDYEGRR